MTDERPRPGPSTRAIRAASRIPRVTPDADDRPDLPDRDVRLGATPRSWPRSSPASSPGTRTAGSTTRRSSALGDAVAELHDAEAGHRARDRHGRDPRRRSCRILRAGDRLLVGQVGYGTTRTQASRAFGRLGIEVGVCRHDRHRRRRGGARGRGPRGSSTSRRSPTRPACSPTSRALADARAPPRRAADGRQHVRLAAGLPAARARRGPRDGVRDEVPRPGTAT